MAQIHKLNQLQVTTKLRLPGHPPNDQNARGRVQKVCSDQRRAGKVLPGAKIPTGGEDDALSVQLYR